MSKKRLILSIVVPIIIIVFAVITAKLIIKSKPDVKRRKPPKSVLTVEVMTLKKSDFQVWLKSNGIVRPRTQGTLVPEVSGRIIKVSPNFREGSFFEKGDVLLEIDSKNYETAIVVANAVWMEAKRNLEEEKAKDYEAALIMAKAELALARMKLKEEEAESAVALSDWEIAGLKQGPSDLVLRIPQLTSAKSQLEAGKALVSQRKRDLKLRSPHLEAAEAAIESAVAKLNQKKLDLVKTKIEAPYAGRIRKQRVDFGQYVSPGTVLADIYAIDYVEIRLPLTEHQMAFIDLPELYRGESEDKMGKGPFVKFKTGQGAGNYTREGHIVRTEGAIDPRSQQLFVVAQIDGPYERQSKDAPPLKIGQFIEAEIKGTLLKDVFVIPSSTLGEGSKVLIVDGSSHLSHREVNVIWSTNGQAVVDSGLSSGEQLSLTPLRYVVNNKPIKVQIKGGASDTDKVSHKPHNKKPGSGG